MASSRLETITRSVAALGAIALFNGGSCMISYCSENCDPCVSTCQCHTCQHTTAADWDSSHRLRVFDLHEIGGETERHQVLASIGGLTLERALGRASFDANDLRHFSEGVIGVNRELLDIAPEQGMWSFTSVESFEAGSLVHFEQRARDGELAAGALDFLYDRRGALSEIDRITSR